ncbi:phosphotransferase [Desmospora profundinema]|uniref:Spore coat protein YsxE n=1 Tax=Desmospora profundinema TaxID=1571184 RepID=A0ABU1IR77_9BACL|nr:phosphotransferase [Desmospora profundinema]MDR6226439.1 spore coat protein YsxE [Desmospora profundinema]
MKLDAHRDGPVMEQVFRRFGWSPHQVEMVRGVLQVQTNGKVFALKKAVLPAKEMKKIQTVLHEITAKEYPHLLPFEKTVDGETGVETEVGYWMAQEWYGQGAERGDEVPLADLIRSLARFHRLTMPLAAGKKEDRRRLDQSEVKRRRSFEKRLEEWASIAREREFPSPFDKAFETHLPYVQKALSFSLQGMEKYIQGERGEAPRYTWVHGRVHPRNLVVGEEGWRWIDWEHAGIDSPVRDVAGFLRRLIPMDGDEVTDPFALLAEYEDEFPFNGKEKRLLSLYLTFPEQPLKLMEQYYAGNRQDEGTLVRRLEEEMDRLQLFQDWVRKHWAKKPTKKAKRKELAGIRTAKPRSR